jgi:DNA processing protein
MKRKVLSEKERSDWLRLIRTPNIGPITFFQLLDRFGDAATAIDALPSLLKASGASRRLDAPSAGEVSRELERLSRAGARMIAACEPDYPGLLAAIDAPPPVIFTIGDVSLAKRDTVALVGARNSSAVGRRMARDLAQGLSQADYVIVSGLARGVDGEAHQAALAGGTIAVLAGGVDQPYPPENQKLYEEICERGLVVSESGAGYVATARDFPKRNRIISGLSLGVVVVEAAERSGSLITARCALEQGREVLAVPGSPLDLRCRGANRLIKQGAALVEDAEDVLRVLNGLPRASFGEPDWHGSISGGGAPEAPRALIEAVRTALSPTPMPVAEIVRAVDAPHRMVLAAIAELELAGVAITHVGGLASLAV